MVTEPIEERARQYHNAFNGLNYLLELSESLRKTNFSFEVLPILAEGVKTMEENLILNDVKYLDKRSELYLKMGKIYEEWEHYPEAVALLDQGIKAYKAIKGMHEQDQNSAIKVS